MVNYYSLPLSLPPSLPLSLSLSLSVSIIVVGDVITVELSSNTFSVVEGDRFVNVVILKSGITDVDLFVSVILSSLSAEGIIERL